MTMRWPMTGRPCGSGGRLLVRTLGGARRKSCWKAHRPARHGPARLAGAGCFRGHAGVFSSGRGRDDRGPARSRGALCRRLDLAVEATRALVAVDVNTGGHTGAAAGTVGQPIGPCAPCRAPCVCGALAGRSWSIAPRCRNATESASKRPRNRPFARTGSRPALSAGRLLATWNSCETRTSAPERGPEMNCPVCQKPTDKAYRPFCSKRCADVDLGRWFNGSYAVPDRGRNAR